MAEILLTRSVPERLHRLRGARDHARDLLDTTPAIWENSCEDAFHELRLSVVHMRKELAMLEALEGKEYVWRFICRFSRERRFMHERCIEVLRILMLSDAWMSQFKVDPECDAKDLPQSIVDEFSRRVSEVGPPPESQLAHRQRVPRETARGHAPQPDQNGWRDGAKEAPATDAFGLQRPTGVCIVVQQCAFATIVVDERRGLRDSIGQGLVVYVSFAKGACLDRVRSAARFLLNAKLSTALSSTPGLSPDPRRQDAESILTLCARGQPQGILVMPQASLASQVGRRDLLLHYDRQCEDGVANTMYSAFVDAIRSMCSQTAWDASDAGWKSCCTPKVVAAPYRGSRELELRSADPFMHAFSF